MVGVFVAFIRVVYGRMIYMSLPTYSKNTRCDFIISLLMICHVQCHLICYNSNKWADIFADRQIKKKRFTISRI